MDLEQSERAGRAFYTFVIMRARTGIGYTIMYIHWCVKLKFYMRYMALCLAASEPSDYCMWKLWDTHETESVEWLFKIVDILLTNFNEENE